MKVLEQSQEEFLKKSWEKLSEESPEEFLARRVSGRISGESWEKFLGKPRKNPSNNWNILEGILNKIFRNSWITEEICRKIPEVK